MLAARNRSTVAKKSVDLLALLDRFTQQLLDRLRAKQPSPLGFRRQAIRQIDDEFHVARPLTAGVFRSR